MRVYWSSFAILFLLILSKNGACTMDGTASPNCLKGLASFSSTLVLFRPGLAPHVIEEIL
jgi:hypothetical protein